jgi:proteic killer suppression protein
MESKLVITRTARKALEKAPQHVQDKFFTWAAAVERNGLEDLRKVPAYHDEPLKGKRLGQRSVRLNRQWRAIYEETDTEEILITVLEVTAHDYRTR